MFYQDENYFYQEDSVYQTLAVKSSENENAFLNVTVQNGQTVTFAPSIIDPENKDRKLMSEFDEIVFRNDHPCFNALYNFAEAVATVEPQVVNNEDPKMQSPNYLVCFRGKTQVKFVFVNALPEQINEVKAKTNWQAKNAAKNLMKDVKKLTHVPEGDEMTKSR